MSYHELVCYIVSNYASHFLVPLSEKYDTQTWNAAMREAFERMELVRIASDVNMFDRRPKFIDLLSRTKGTAGCRTMPCMIA